MGTKVRPLYEGPQLSDRSAVSRDDEGLSRCDRSKHPSVVVAELPLRDRRRPGGSVARDPQNWPVVASALALSAGILDGRHGLPRVGVPTWTTETLQGWLDRHPDA